MAHLPILIHPLRSLAFFSLEPKMTLAVYIGASVVFVAFITWMFVYSSRLKTRKLTEQKLGRPPAVPEEGIAIATEAGRPAETQFDPQKVQQREEQKHGTSRNP